MIKFMITAPSSNTGKTAVTCGLLSLFERKGFDPCAFKCGPDYIDPMFHRSVMGIQSNNLDVFLAGEDGVRDVFAAYSKGHDAAICEGVMGYYDGRTVGSTEASAWHVASLLGIEPSECLAVSGKTGAGVAELLDRIVREVPPPVGELEGKTRAMIFDSVYDTYRGVVTYVRVVDGRLRPRDRIQMMSTGAVHELLEIGVISPT